MEWIIGGFLMVLGVEFVIGLSKDYTYKESGLRKRRGR